MMRYYVYKTQTGTLKMADAYVAGHILIIHAKTLTAAKTAFTKYKKMIKQDGE
tara:strand:- start:2098 stop:2256 length:159 start_codon:yes stop_codon:yes gene_type:complete